MSELPPASAFDAQSTSPAVRALFGADAVVRAMLEVEAALVQAQAEQGLVLPEHSRVIAGCCTHGTFDVASMVAASARAGSLAIPMVQALTARVREVMPEAAASVHLGATSQDIVDTAWCLQAAKALALIDADVRRLLLALLDLEQRHGRAPMLARTLMQGASLTTFSARVLNWFAPVARSRVRLHELWPRALRLQLAGAVGTRAAWGPQGDALARAVAGRLGLPADVQPWQVQRDEFLRLCAELGVLSGTLAKVAQDVALMSQTEVGELQESAGSGRGTSSAMPHKRNPVGSLVARAAGHRAAARMASLVACMAHEHERALGAWQAELAEAADLLALVGGAASAMADALTGATVDQARMRAHIDGLLGLPMAEALSRQWAGLWGRDAAHARVQALCAQAVQQGVHLSVLARQALGPSASNAEHAALEKIFDVQQASAAGEHTIRAAWNDALELQRRLP